MKIRPVILCIPANKQTDTQTDLRTEPPFFLEVLSLYVTGLLISAVLKAGEGLTQIFRNGILCVQAAVQKLNISIP